MPMTENLMRGSAGFSLDIPSLLLVSNLADATASLEIAEKRLTPVAVAVAYSRNLRRLKFDFCIFIFLCINSDQGKNTRQVMLLISFIKRQRNLIIFFA